MTYNTSKYHTVLQHILNSPEFSIDLDAGIIYRNNKPHGNYQTSGYEQGSYQLRPYNQVLLLTHRLIFLHQHGHLPDLVDHIDRDRTNNAIHNLRASNATLNAINRGRFSTRSNTGHSGITYVVTKSGKIRYRVVAAGKYLGIVDTFQQAQLIWLVSREGTIRERCKDFGVAYENYADTDETIYTRSTLPIA